MTATHQSASADAIALLVRTGRREQDMTGVLRADTASLQPQDERRDADHDRADGKKLGEMSNHLVQSPLLRTGWGHIERKETPGTYPVGLGLFLLDSACPNTMPFAVYQYGTASMILSASLRLMKYITSTQTILFEVIASTEAEYERVSRATLDENGYILTLARYHGSRARQGARTHVHELNHRSMP